MVFYRGKAPTGNKTKWKMNEYKVIQDHIPPHSHSPSSSTPTPQVRIEIKYLFTASIFLLIYSCLNIISIIYRQLRHEFSLCRVYVVSGSFRAFDRRPLQAHNSSTHIR